MFKPSDLTTAARIALLLGAGVVAVLMLAPAFQGAERAIGLSDKEAHAAAFYLFTLTAFLAAPRMRRNDLALAAFAIGVAAEAAQLLTGRDASLADIAADALGVALAWGPTQVDQWRRLARRHPWLTFAQIRDLDRRRPALGDRAAGSRPPAQKAQAIRADRPA